jgi:pimeloyl-ACP methyl ester carboxylesterase
MRNTHNDGGAGFSAPVARALLAHEVELDGQTWELISSEIATRASQSSHPSRAPLVMLPGVVGGPAVFHKQLAGLHVPSRIVVAGYPPLSSAAAFSDALAQLIERLRLGRVDLFGASLGGHLAQHFAMRHPAAVRRVLVANSFLQTPKRAALPGREEHLLARLGFSAADAGVYFDLRHSRYAMLAHCEAVPKPAQALAAIIDCEDDDFIAPDERLALRRRYPHARVYSLSSGRHFPYLANPDAFNRILDEELQEP